MFLVLVSVLLLFRGISCCEQETFKNAYVVAYVDKTDQQGKEFTINGCLGRTPELDTYQRIECKVQSVRKMFKGAVANLSTSIMIFNNNGLEEIEPGAFDLPRITELDISKNRIQRIKQGVFGPLITLASLNLDNNKITEIEAGAFANMLGLKELSLQNNMITLWGNTWFRNNLYLDKINLNDNLIDFFPANAIKEIPNVKNIYLRRNKLSRIHSNALEGKERLYQLDLSENFLKELPSNLFSSFNVREPPRGSGLFDVGLTIRASFAGVQNLYLHKNNLTYLPQEIMNDLSANNNILFINLHSNPWHCACYKIIERWVRKRGAKLDVFGIGCLNKKNPICVVPDKNSDKCVEEVDEQIYSIYYATYKEATERDRFDRDVKCF